MFLLATENSACLHAEKAKAVQREATDLLRGILAKKFVKLEANVVGASPEGDIVFAIVLVHRSITFHPGSMGRQTSTQLTAPASRSFSLSGRQRTKTLMFCSSLRQALEDVMWVGERRTGAVIWQDHRLQEQPHHETQTRT